MSQARAVASALDERKEQGRLPMKDKEDAMIKTIKQWLGAKSVAKAEVAPAKEPLWMDRVVDVEAFSRIEARGRVWVEWSPGANMCVATACADDEAAHAMVLRVEAGVMVVEQPQGARHPARVRVSSARLDGFGCKGEAGGCAQGIDADIFEARLEDGARLMLSGRTVAARLWIAGKGALDADQLVAHAVAAKATGAGLIEARAEAIAEITIDAGAEIVIKGNPAVSKIERLGDGRAKIGSKVDAAEEENPGGIFDQLPIPKR